MKKLIQSLSLLLLLHTGYAIASEGQNTTSAPVVAGEVFGPALPAYVLRHKKIRSDDPYRNILERARQKTLRTLEAKMEKVLRELEASPMSEGEKRRACSNVMIAFSAVMTTCALT